MSPAIPIDRVDPKQPLGKFVAGAWRPPWRSTEALAQPPPFAGDRLTIAGFCAGSRPSEVSTIDDSYRWLVDELDGVEMRLSPRGRRLAKALRKRLIDRLPPDPDSEYDLARARTSWCVVGQRGAPLLQRDAQQDGRQRDRAALRRSARRAEPPSRGRPGPGGGGWPAGDHHFEGTVGLTAGRLPPGLAEPQQSAADLARLLTFPHSGDLVVIGVEPARPRRDLRKPECHARRHRGPQEYPSSSRSGSALDVTHVTKRQPDLRLLHPGVSAAAGCRNRGRRGGCGG